ncbi:MAG: mechanosensitive ion channel family protein [Lachnospiraceae bacterium]|nr:mechanosensitive ion channel family protein [Lachnospiraceae bacterium]
MLDLTNIGDKALTFISNIQWTRLIISVIILAIAFTAWLGLRKLCRKWMNGENARGSKKTFAPVLWTVIRTVLILITGMIILEVNGVNVSAALTGLGIASATVALAVQDILKDVIMGIHILSDRFFQVGDVVILNGRMGVVEDFSLKTTKIRDLDEPGLRCVCNRNIEDITVPADMIILKPGLPYGLDPRVTDEVLGSAAARIAKLEDVTDARYVGIGAFEDSAVSHRIFIYCPKEELYRITRAANRIVLECLNEASIGIPFPQMDLHIKDMAKTSS